jgi:hypothetical protein
VSRDDDRRGLRHSGPQPNFAHTALDDPCTRSAACDRRRANDAGRLSPRTVCGSRAGRPRPRLLGLGLLMVDLLAVATLYLGLLSILSRQSITELKQLGKVLLARDDHAASSAG